eukprot:1196331-Prorocentrum_minimum.AAC.4
MREHELVAASARCMSMAQKEIHAIHGRNFRSNDLEISYTVMEKMLTGPVTPTMISGCERSDGGDNT